MSELKKCECGKVISDELGVCWECWNEDQKRKQKAYYCKCGVDVSKHEYLDEKGCTHSFDEPTKPEKIVRLSEKQYTSLEYPADREKAFKRDVEWEKLERKNAEVVLNNLIDETLMLGNKEDFLQLTDKLKRLKGEAING